MIPEEIDNIHDYLDGVEDEVRESVGTDFEPQSRPYQNLLRAFSSVDKNDTPFETVLDQQYFIVDNDTWNFLVDHSSGKDESSKRNGGHATSWTGGMGVVILDTSMEERYLTAPLVHEETHVATLLNNGFPPDKSNCEGIAWARENVYGMKQHRKPYEWPGDKEDCLAAKAWTPAYRSAVEELGDETALGIAREVFSQDYEADYVFSDNPYIQDFESRVEEYSGAEKI